MHFLLCINIFGFHSQALVAAGVGTGVASVKSCQNLPLCPVQPVAGVPMMTPPLKAGQFRNGGNTSVTTYSRRRRTITTAT